MIPEYLKPEHDKAIAAQLHGRVVRALVRGSMPKGSKALNEALRHLDELDAFVADQRADIEYRARLLVVAATESILDSTYVGSTWVDEADFRESEASDHV